MSLARITISSIILLFIIGLLGYQVTINNSNKEMYGSYRVKRVKTVRGRYSIRMVTINLNNPAIKVVTDTGNTTSCKSHCTVKSLSSYYRANRGIAAINGTYFCPSDYASCAGKNGWYFWRVYNNRVGVMFNPSNGHTRNDPLLVFDSFNKPYLFRHAIDFVNVNNFETTYNTSLTGAIGGLELVYNHKVTLKKSKLDNKQKYTKGPRGAVGIKNNTLYMVTARGATVIDMAYIMRALGVDYAINIDGGGSTALMYKGRYKAGPGRRIPNALIVARRITPGFGY